ncbi:MAG: hypothetical protein OHK93_004633 [Ramalina farinacea]|uniref:Uncharacterized protein n=1 Tax=Ramalina farinacea TaxID=258253 RepID=A0AA43QUJ6_9LECA|nr:hypothetical protein [Ramalina farinacea]
MSSPPKCQFSWQFDGDAFASQIEHVEHVKWGDQASNEPPGFSLADDAMNYAWEDSGNGSSVSDVPNWKDPRRLTRSDVMDEFSSRWYGIDGFRDDGIEADARFLGLIDEHESSQRQEQQPNTAESSQSAGSPAPTSPAKRRCDQASTPPQAKRDRKDAQTHPRPATALEAVHIPMLPAVPTSLLSEPEGDHFETDGDNFQANEPKPESESRSQEMFDIPSIDGVADTEFDTLEMQQYLFNLHAQGELARQALTGLHERGHSSVAVDCPQLETSHLSDSSEDIPDSRSGEVGSSGEDPATDQQSPSDQVPSLVTGSTVESTISSAPAKEIQPRRSNSQLNLRGGDPNDGLSSYVGGILTAVTSSENSFQGLSSETSLSKTACTPSTQSSTDESLYDPFYPSAQHSFNNTPSSRQIGFRANPAVSPFPETKRHSTPHKSIEINQYSYSPLSGSAHSNSQRLPISKRSSCSKRRKQTHSGSPPKFQQSSPPDSPTRLASDITPPTSQAQAFAKDGSDYNPTHRSPVPFSTQTHTKTLGGPRLDPHPTPSTTTFSSCASTPSSRSQKVLDEKVIQKLEEMSRIIIADQRANAEMERQITATKSQQADCKEVDSASGWR